MRFLILALALLIAACEAGPGKPRLYAQARSGERTEALLARLYPPGTPEPRLIAALQADGFTVDAEANTAAREWTRFPCANWLKISWRVDAHGDLLAVESKLDQACT